MDLVTVLNQEGHSGIIDGYCKLSYKQAGWKDIEDFYRKYEGDKIIEITFSSGTHALGTYDFKITDKADSIFSGYLILKNNTVPAIAIEFWGNYSKLKMFNYSFCAQTF